MAVHQPATPARDAILRPPCSKCATKTNLIEIEPDEPGYDLLTFQCPACGQFEVSIVPPLPCDRIGMSAAGQAPRGRSQGRR